MFDDVDGVFADEGFAAAEAGARESMVGEFVDGGDEFVFGHFVAGGGGDVAVVALKVAAVGEDEGDGVGEGAVRSAGDGEAGGALRAT